MWSKLDKYEYIYFFYLGENGHSEPLSSVGRLRFEQFDMAKVLANSTHLMASEGKEYDFDEEALQSKH